MELQNSNISLPYSNEIRAVGGEVIKKMHDVIQPTYDITRKYSDVAFSVELTTTGTTIIFSTGLDRWFYITSIQLCQRKNVTCDGTKISLNATINGLNTQIMVINSEPLQVFQEQKVLTFAHPLRVDRNTAMSMTLTFTAGAMVVNAIVTGFFL